MNESNADNILSLDGTEIMTDKCGKGSDTNVSNAQN